MIFIISPVPALHYPPIDSRTDYNTGFHKIRRDRSDYEAKRAKCL